MGHVQAKQPKVLKEFVRPAYMIISPTDTASVASLSRSILRRRRRIH